METARPKRIRVSGWVLRAGLIAAFLYLAVSLISSQVIIVAKRQQLAQVTQQVETQLAANLELQRTLDSGDEDAYTERVARNKLGFALPDERIYVDMSGK